MLDEGDKLVPGISQARVLRAWAGVRPLYQEGFSGQSRDATRALTLLDHLKRDGVAGFLTITGGKWTTFRLMAETTMDMACQQLGVERPCKTADTVVPGIEQGHYWLGHRLREGCRALPDPQPLGIFDHVYSEITDELVAQRDGFEAYLASFEGAH